MDNEDIINTGVSEMELDNKNNEPEENEELILEKKLGPGFRDEDIRDEDDSIVKELDVLVSPNLSSQLYLLQYPLRSPSRPYDYQKLTGTKFKYKSQKLQREYSIDDKSEYFDQNSDNPVTTLTLCSSSVPSRAEYAICVLRNNQIHMTAIQGGCLQLRPSFNHIDDKKESQKKEQMIIDEVEEKEEEEDDKEKTPAAPKPMQIQFKKKRK